jgi:hypothetical protein
MRNLGQPPEFDSKLNLPLSSDPRVISTQWVTFFREISSKSATRALKLIVSGREIGDLPPAVVWNLKKWAATKQSGSDEDLRQVAMMTLSDTQFELTRAIAGLRGGRFFDPIIGAISAHVHRKYRPANYPDFGGYLEQWELHRITHSQYWARKDEAHLRLSPGEERKYRTSHKVGLTSEAVTNLSQELGLKIPIFGAADLKAKAASELQLSLDISDERVDDIEEKISNDRQGYYRHMAFWFTRDELTIETASAPPIGASSRTAENSGLEWHRSAQYFWDSQNAPQSSSIDIPI